MFLLAALYAIARDCDFPLVDNSLGYYFQDLSHFKHYQEDIKKLFGQNIGKKIDMVAIHVRRASNPLNQNEPKYTDNPFYVNLSETNYYADAMEEFPGADFLVFSDDIEWCKQQTLFAGCEFSEGKSELEDMNIMASCTGHIIANSSYSWWGAFISPYTQKVIAPKNWYTDTVERTTLPDNWVTL